MGFGNAYYTVDRDTRVWRHVGISQSNTWIGSSRVVTKVMEAVNARAGDELHVLLGGTFLKSGDGVHQVSLKAPKPPLEKDYGAPSPSATAEFLARAGRLSALSRPTETDYVGAREACSANDMGPLRPQVLEVEPSPEMRFVAGLADDLRAAHPDLSISLRDVDAYMPARMEAKVDGDVVVRVLARVDGFSASLGGDAKTYGPGSDDEVRAAVIEHVAALQVDVAPTP